VVSDIDAVLLGEFIGAVFLIVGGAIWVWIDRRTDDPVMKHRINEGSDRFFAEQEKRDMRTLFGEMVDADDEERTPRLVPTRRRRSESLPPGRGGDSSGSA
jgi:hypothetical protein